MKGCTITIRAAIIVDIDNTLLKDDDSKIEDWDTIFITSKPTSWCMSLIHVYVMAGFTILISTKIENKDDLVDWFKKHMPLLKKDKDYVLFKKGDPSLDKFKIALVVSNCRNEWNSSDIPVLEYKPISRLPI